MNDYAVLSGIALGTGLGMMLTVLGALAVGLGLITHMFLVPLMIGGVVAAFGLAGLAYSYRRRDVRVRS